MNAWNARKEAAQCLQEILSQNGYSTIVIDRRIQKYPPSVDYRDKALVTHLVYNTLSHLRRIDHLIDAWSKVPVRKMKPFIAAVMRITCEQMLYDERIPDRAAIHEAVEIVKNSPLRSLSGFVNGVLRAMERGGLQDTLPPDPVQAQAILYSLPDAVLEEWVRDYGQEEAFALAAVLAEEPCLQIRCNTLRTDPQALLEELVNQPGAVGARISETCPWILKLDHADGMAAWPAIREGRMVVQNESSVLAAMATLAAPDSRILDMCAAPGGKSTCMAQMMEDRGRIVSCDLYAQKVETVQAQSRRMDLHCLEARLQDGCQFVPEWEQAFDTVLLDAPCSGLGILRSKPDIRWNRAEADFTELPELQRRLLANAARYVRPGGRLVYSTCTLRAAENERQAHWFLTHFPEFAPADLQKDLPILGICDTIKGTYAQIPATDAGWCTIRPQEGGRDGFFIAAFTKER